MLSRFLLTLSAVFLGLSLVNAQNVNGHWYGNVSDGNKDFPLLFIFHAKSEHQLSGTIITPLGSRTLENCQMDRDSLFFIDKFGSNTLYHYAKVYQDSITMKMKGLWGNDTFYYFTLKRKEEFANKSLKDDSLFVRKQLQ